MACLSYLLKGISYDCSPNLAGIKQLLLTYKDNVNVTINRDTNTAYVSLVSGEWYEYSFGRNGASMSASMVKDEPSETKYYNYTLEMSFNKLSPDKNLELYALASEKLVAIIVDNNNQSWFCGYDGYLNASVEELTTGSGYGDRNGYKVTLNGSSRSLPFTYSNEPAPTPTVTGISFTLTWVTDVPASGGTANKNNCTYTVTSHLSDGTSVDVTSQATISGSASVPASSDTNRHSAGTLTLTATYGGFSSVTNTTIYQAGNDSPIPPTPSGATVTAITLSNCVLHKDVPASGITSSGYTITTSDCTYTITGNYSDGTSGDITSIADCFGTTVVYCGDNTGTTRRQVGTLTLQAHYEGLFDYETVPIYQAAAEPTPSGATLTGITLTNLVATHDIPATVPSTGYTMDYNDCTYTVTAYYDNGDTEDITNIATMIGHATYYGDNNTPNRVKRADLFIQAKYGEFLAVDSTEVYQAANDSPVPPTPPSSGGYLTFNIVSAGTLNWHRVGTTLSVEYSTNSGLTWSTMANSPIEVSAGDTVMFRGSGTSVSYSAYGYFSGSSSYNLSGNIMSLVYGDNYEGQTTLQSELTFFRLFKGNSGLLSAEDLILPATSLTFGCYEKMFADCTNLTKAPRVLPATTLSESCYSEMFNGCAALTTAPNLPATTLEINCYGQMFKNCTSLTTAPELPATSLFGDCYSEMFNGCTSLTTAPDLPAAILEPNCYFSMFYNCSNLSYIKCLATDVSEEGTIVDWNCVTDWVYGVASAGTFVKASGMTGWTIDSPDGIPVGWTVQNDN